MKSRRGIRGDIGVIRFDGSLRAAADLAGCSHHTVARVVAERDAGGARPRTCRPRLIDEFLPKVEEWVEASKARRVG